MSITEMNTTNGIMVHIFPVQIVLNKSAVFTTMIFRPDGLHRATFVLEGDDYKNWGIDDDYIKNYIFDKEIYLGRPSS